MIAYLQHVLAAIFLSIPCYTCLVLAEPIAHEQAQTPRDATSAAITLTAITPVEKVIDVRATVGTQGTICV